MTSMVERVALAIGAAEMGGPVEASKWRAWEEPARAAIAAMREPTGYMTEVGGAVVVAKGDSDGDYNAPIGEYEAEEAYVAMIAAALEEKP